MKPDALHFTRDELNALIVSHVATVLPPEKLAEIAERTIAERLLSPEQAARKFQCANVRQLRDFLRAQKIPIIHGTAKKWWVLNEDAEAWILRHRVTLPGSATGTVILSTHRAATKPATSVRADAPAREPGREHTSALRGNFSQGRAA